MLLALSRWFLVLFCPFTGGGAQAAVVVALRVLSTAGSTPSAGLWPRCFATTREERIVGAGKAPQAFLQPRRRSTRSGPAGRKVWYLPPIGVILLGVAVA